MSDQRVAIVTGGARGIGASITTMLARQGVHVAAGYSSNRAAADAVTAQAKAEGSSVSIHQGNVGDPKDCLRVVQEVLDTHGRINYLVNNAGITMDKTVSQMSIEDWHTVMRINLSGAFYMTKAVLDHMVSNQFGRIVNISSVVGETGMRSQAPYAASKSGMVGFTKSLALEVAHDGITVNCVAPGYVETDMVASVEQETMKRLVSRVPIRRLAKGSEIARAVTFLTDDDAGYITGTVLSVNGGLDM